MPHAGLSKAKAEGRPSKAAPLVRDPICKGKPGSLGELSCVSNMSNHTFKYNISFPQWAPDGRLDIFGNLCEAGDECL